MSIKLLEDPSGTPRGVKPKRGYNEPIWYWNVDWNGNWNDREIKNLV
jgi:hypothetical protein